MHKIVRLLNIFMVKMQGENGQVAVNTMHVLQKTHHYFYIRLERDK